MQRCVAFTSTTKLIEFESNNKESRNIHARVGKDQSERVKSFGTSENRVESASVTDDLNKGHGFMISSEHRNLKNKRSSTPYPVDMEPIRKQIRPNDVKTRLFTGDVQETMNFKKKFPNMDVFFEVFGKIVKVDGSRDRQKIILLKNGASGPIIQAVYNEIDYKIIELKSGDWVRCVGKIINRSRLNLFKVSIITENQMKIVPRLFALCDFVSTKLQTMQN